MHCGVQQGKRSASCGLHSMPGATVQSVVQQGSLAQLLPQSQSSPGSTKPLPQRATALLKHWPARAVSTVAMLVVLQSENLRLLGWARV